MLPGRLVHLVHLALMGVVLACASPGATPDRSPVTPAAEVAAPSPTPPELAPGLRVELVADGLQLPSNLVFAPDGRLFLTEVSRGTIRVIDQGHLVPEPVAALDVANQGEQGLLGLALDPSFAENHYLYVFYSEPRDGKGWRNRVVRLTESGGRAGDLRVVLDDLPLNNRYQNAGHNGGRLAFGADGSLFFTIGDLGQTVIAQDQSKLAGKLLRIRPDGSIPPDNPFAGSPIYAVGLRNSYGLTIQPTTGVPYVTDNGPEGHDEVNRIRPGGNYGSPEVNGIRRNPRFIDPIWESHAARGGISGLTFYTGRLFPAYRDNLLFCTFTSGYLRLLQLGGPDLDQVVSEELLSDQCNLDVVTGPDGAIYVSSVTRVQRLLPAQ